MDAFLLIGLALLAASIAGLSGFWLLAQLCEGRTSGQHHLPPSLREHKDHVNRTGMKPPDASGPEVRGSREGRSGTAGSRSRRSR